MMTLEVMRQIVKANTPYDTGFMFMFGNRFNETDAYLCAYYDSTAVPYIIHNELGHNNNPNKGFISVDTVNDLNFISSGVNAEQQMSMLNQVQDKNILGSSMVSSGVMEYLQSYGKVAGMTYEHYTP